MNTKNTFTVSEVIDSLKINKFTWLVFVLLGFTLIFDGYDFMIANTTNLAVSRTYWNDNPTPGPLMGALATWSLLGMVAGAAFGGILADRFGRKKMLVAAVLFYSVFTFPQAASPSFEFHVTFRVIAGIGIGLCIPIVTTMFSELMPSKRRGVFITFGMAFMVLGWVLAGFIGNPITYATNPLIPGFTELVTYTTVDSVTGEIITGTMYANWRVCYLIGGIPLAFAILLIFVMKETPHWYANNGRVEDAVKCLSQIEKMATGKVTERDSSLLVVPPRPKKSNPPILFSKKYIIATSAIWSTAFISQFCVYGMNTWLPSWFVGIGYSSTDAVTLQTLNNVAAVVANISVGFISDIVGRRRNLLFAWLFAIAAIILCSVFVVGNNFALCIGLMLLFGFALNYTITAIEPIMPESYPTQFRNTGVAWAKAFGRFGGAAAPIVLGAFATMEIFASGSATNWSTLVLILTIPLAVGFVCTLVFLRHETKGKTMDAIQTEIETA